MKKRLCIILLAVILYSALLCTGASANSWGLTGKLYQAVEQSKAWDDYTTLSNQDGPFAVMQARYHNALFFVDGQGGLHVYTTAVYQPDEKKKAPSLFLDGDMLHLSYGDQEKYVFKAVSEDGEYHLLSAEIGSFQLVGNYDESDMHIVSYWANGKDDTALWPVTVRLSDFNINLLPHSVEEVRAQNQTFAQFDSALQCLGNAYGSGENYSPDQPGELLQLGKKGTAPVYSAPFGKSAWRAGKGKAAVGLNGDMWLLSQFKNADNESYACIRYNVSERTQRIGYALCKELSLPEITDWNPDEPLTGFAHVDVEAAADTYLTDDPDVSQFRQFTVPRGTQFSCMGLYNNHYAYVSAEVKNGKFVDGGAIAWGFVPIRDLKVMEQEKAPEATNQMIGDWMLYAGGSMADDYLFLHEDGTFTTNNMQWETGEVWQDNNTSKSWGTWYVTKYNPFMNLYWNKPPYQLTLIYHNGRVIMRGLEITEEGFSLTDEEGGGGYVPVTEGDLELSEFNLAAAQELCENALSILKDPERSRATDQGYRVVHVAMDQYNPEIPNRFDSRMDEEEKLLYLTREDQNGTIQTTWIFHWEEKAEAWLLVRAKRIEYTGTEYDEDSIITEWITEITTDAVHTTKWLRDHDTQQVLYTYWDVTYPNVLDQDCLLLKRFNFDTPPVNATGYNWSRNYGAFADPTLLPKLYARFFSENQYVDGYLQEDRTLSFIVRKENGDLVLLCGANENETSWEWVESSPLPEGAHFGDENITDAVNMNAWQGGAAVGVRRYGKGRWGLSYVNSYDFFVGPDWIGTYGSWMDSQFFGTHAWGDITAIDWLSLPPEEFSVRETKEEKDARLSAMVDRTDWAVTAQDDPGGTTNLLPEAGEAASQLGSFYNGTPLFVLEHGSEWTKVRIGSDGSTGTMTGWMRTEDLAFGDDMLQVDREVIQAMSEKVLLHSVEPFTGSETGIITAGQFSGCLVIGEAGSDQRYAIVYSLKDGNVGLVPITSLGNGNG